MKKAVLLSLLSFVYATSSLAYVEAVHRRITRHAFDRLTDFSLQYHLGVTRQSTVRGMTPEQWAILGSDLEDEGFRSLNHFFDPVHQAPLTIGEPPLCTTDIPVLPNDTVRADEWSLGSGPLLFPNEWNLWQANTSYRNAILGLTREERDRYLARYFRSIGHIVHLVQDMAQPEHTRNDQHRFAFGAAEPSLYEAWGADAVNELDTMMEIEYPEVKLPRYRQYFSSDAIGAPLGAGLADYSNRNFVTQDTSYHDQAAGGRCYIYSLPSQSLATTRVLEDQPHAIPSVTNPGTFDFILVDETVLTAPVVDRYRSVSGEEDIFHSFFSSLDLEARTLGIEVYSLDPRSFNSRANFLLPRAVGYSAGIFRKLLMNNQVHVRWRTSSSASGAYDVIVTNSGLDTIESGATVTANYCPGAAYLAHENDDCARAFTATLPELRRSQSTTIRDVFVPDLLSANDVREFERRTLVSGTIGSEPDSVSGVVQKPATEITWYRTWDEISSSGTSIWESAAHDTMNEKATWSVGLDSPELRMAFHVMGITVLRNSPMATSGLVLANGNRDNCTSCHLAWNGDWALMSWSRFVDDVEFDLNNGSTTVLKTFTVGWKSSELTTQIPPSFPTKITVTLGPGEHRRIKLDAKDILQVGIRDESLAESRYGIDNIAFTFWSED